MSVSTIGTQDDMSDEQLAEAAKAELAAWFGAEHTATWELLRIYRIPFAQPNQARSDPPCPPLQCPSVLDCAPWAVFGAPACGAQALLAC